MILFLIVFLGGVLTILSPCILPVLPFVFARTDRRFLTGGLPMLLGMAGAFAGIATLAAVGGAWAVRINQYGRFFALLLLSGFALTLLSSRLADWLARPFVALGNRLIPSEPGEGQSGVSSSLLLGVATGLLWAPCAGPILGLVLTGAAISGPNVHTTTLLFAYAAGASTSLGVAIAAGGRVFAAMKRSLGAGEWIRRVLGTAILLGVVAITLGWDTTVLTRLSLAGTNRLEQSLFDRVHSRDANGAADSTMAMSGTMTGGQPMMMTTSHPAGPPVEGEMPSLSGATSWFNSPPLTPELLRGKVVLVPSGGLSYRRWPSESRDRRAPKRHSRASMRKITRTASIAAFAVTPHSSIRAPSSSPVPAGRAFGSRSRRRTWSNAPTPASGCSAMPYRVDDVPPIWVTYSTTGRDRPVCAIALIQWRCGSCRAAEASLDS
jgi:cytochrome c biogenesis protein CcdA